MAKIEVPQELVNQIIYLYTEQKHNRKQIKNELNLSFSDSVIKRILEENNVEIRTNPGAQKGGRKKQMVQPELAKKIARMYEEGNSVQVINQKLNLSYSYDKMKSILRDQGIKPRNCYEARQLAKPVELRKYSINDDYDFTTHNGAWLLGFIASDGYLPAGKGSHNRVVISLARKDREVLELIKQELNYTGPIYDYDSTGGYPASSLAFTSKSLRQKIESYGIGNNKTFKLQHLPQNLSNELMIDYIRGYFDGDGCVHEPKDRKIRTSITGANKTFLEDIQNFLEKYYNIVNGHISSTERIHTIYDLRYNVTSSFALCNLLYLNDYLALPRKKNHFLAIKEKYGR